MPLKRRGFIDRYRLQHAGNRPEIHQLAPGWEFTLDHTWAGAGLAGDTLPEVFADRTREDGKGGEGGGTPEGPRTAFTGFTAFPPLAREKRLWVRVSMANAALLTPPKILLTSPYIRRIFALNSLRAVG